MQVVRKGVLKHVDCLFDETIEAADICQGALGDCWLLAAIATLCQRPAFIQNCFITRVFNPFGKYSIKLFDKHTNQFMFLTIDDYIPCNSSGVPIYTKLRSNEAWPLLLEKAFAKFKGSYQALSGGVPLDAMKTMTGYEGEQLTYVF
jgi:calpain-15